MLEDKILLPKVCKLCPRCCLVNRQAGQRGFCGADDELIVARAALHFWEEPPLSGDAGSGTIFFSYCSLRCSYCQNSVIADGDAGAAVSVDRLAETCLELQDQGALNINFVTPTHFAPYIQAAVERARKTGLALPVVWNTSGYESVSAIRQLAGVVDVYLTDFKYVDNELAMRYSRASDYLEVALAALDAMVDQVGALQFDDVDGVPRLKKGVIVRHLMLPGALEDSKRVVSLIHGRYGSAVLLSLMNQYTPVLATEAQGGSVCAQEVLRACPELGQTVSLVEYEELLDFADELGIEDYFWQEGGASAESFIPAFNLKGVI